MMCPYGKKIPIEACEKKIIFQMAPVEFRQTFGDIRFLRMPLEATSNFIDRFQISSKNMLSFRSYDVLGFQINVLSFLQKSETS
jgi:hypothetical protein